MPYWSYRVAGGLLPVVPGAGLISASIPPVAGSGVGTEGWQMLLRSPMSPLEPCAQKPSRPPMSPIPGTEQMPPEGATGCPGNSAAPGTVGAATWAGRVTEPAWAGNTAAPAAAGRPRSAAAAPATSRNRTTAGKRRPVLGVVVSELSERGEAGPEQHWVGWGVEPTAAGWPRRRSERGDG